VMSERTREEEHQHPVPRGPRRDLARRHVQDRSSTATRRPSGRTGSRMVGASGVAPCSREAQAKACKGISGLQAPQARVPRGSGASSSSARLARRASARVDRSQECATQRRAR
jgi:hypothetical protein